MRPDRLGKAFGLWTAAFAATACYPGLVRAEGPAPRAIVVEASDPAAAKKPGRSREKLDSPDCRLREIGRTPADSAKAALVASSLDYAAGFINSFVGYAFGYWSLIVWSSDPNDRIEELLNTSEDLRQIEAEWKRIWSTDPPSPLTPEKVHGNIQ